MTSNLVRSIRWPNWPTRGCYNLVTVSVHFSVLSVSLLLSPYLTWSSIPIVGNFVFLIYSQYYPFAGIGHFLKLNSAISKEYFQHSKWLSRIWPSLLAGRAAMVHFGVIYGPDILGLLSGLQTVTSTSPSMVLVEERPPWPRDHCFTNSITVCFFSRHIYSHTCTHTHSYKYTCNPIFMSIFER